MHEGVMKAWLESSHLNGGNVAYVEELYEAYLDDATSVPEEWREVFEQLPKVDGVDVDVKHSEVRAQFKAGPLAVLLVQGTRFGFVSVCFRILAQIGTSKTLLVVGIRGNLGLIIGTENIPTVQNLEAAKAITVASRDSPLPSPAPGATGVSTSVMALSISRNTQLK